MCKHACVFVCMASCLYLSAFRPLSSCLSRPPRPPALRKFTCQVSRIKLSKFPLLCYFSRTIFFSSCGLMHLVEYLSPLGFTRCQQQTFPKYLKMLAFLYDNTCHRHLNNCEYFEAPDPDPRGREEKHLMPSVPDL